VLAVLIRTHPDPLRFQLELTQRLEQTLGDGGAFASTLSPHAQASMRELVEWLGALR
jgi:hypothetical protein